MISIIVPAYNAEKTITRCIKSILEQSARDFELLLIDDGSTDNTGEICDRFAEIDNRVKVFHKTNGGVSSARNLGLENADGEWITFVDSDDWIVPEALNIDCSRLEEDLIIFPYYVISNGRQRLNTMTCCILKGSDQLIPFYNRYLSCSILKTPWSKLFKKSKLKDLRFNESIRLGEDTLFMLDYLKNIHSCRILDKPLYVYNEPDEPISSKYRLSVEESIYTMMSLFNSYDNLSIENKSAEKYIFLDYKLYCDHYLCENPASWFDNPYVKIIYNRVKKTLGLKYRFRYRIISNRMFFRLNKFMKKKILHYKSDIHPNI